MQATFQQNSYSLFKQQNNYNRDYLVNTSAINIPLLVKYRSTGNTFRTFFNFGPTVTYYLKKRNDLIEVENTTGTTVIEINKTPLNSISQYQIGGSLGAGFEYSLLTTKALSVEIRYNQGVGIGGTNQHSASAFQFITSVYF